MKDRSKSGAGRKRESELRTKRAKKAKASPKPLGSVKVLWGEKNLPSRGPKPMLSADQIARAAIRIADAEGLAAVSMQRIAREVHVTTMALYRYFSSKAELVDLMIDIAGGPAPDLNAVSKKWRPRLNEWTRRCSSIYRKHSWFLQARGAPANHGTERACMAGCSPGPAWRDRTERARAARRLPGLDRPRAQPRGVYRQDSTGPFSQAVGIGYEDLIETAPRSLPRPMRSF